MPTSQDTLLMFVSHLAQEGLSHTTIKVYLSAVRYQHITAGFYKEFSSHLTPRLEMVLKGIKKDTANQHNTRPRLPVTIEILAKMKAVLLCKPQDYNNIMLWAACCTAFFGFLRCSEFTVPSQVDYLPDTHLSLSDVAIDCKESPAMVQITIKQSKTDPFRQGVQICLGKTDKDICPISALLPYLAARGSCPGPLFIQADGAYLTRQHFTSLLTSTLQRAGIDDKRYTTHSFRIGAATSAKDAGISDVHIKMLGRWKSNAYQLYVRTPRNQLAKLSKQMVSVM